MPDKQNKVKERGDVSQGPDRAFAVGDRVLVKIMRGKEVSWQDSVVTQVVSDVTYSVQVVHHVR